MNFLDNTLEFIGAVIVGGGGLSIIVYHTFKHLGAKWLDSKFDERLQDLKHQHDKEIEQLRFKINSLLNRTMKVQEREFEVLSDAWEKLSEGFWSTKSLVGSLQEFPDVNHMSQEELEELLSSSKFLETQKQKIREAPDKWKCYVDFVRWRRLGETKSKVREAATYLEVNGIFIKPDIRKQFGALVDLAWQALIEYQMNMEHDIAPRRNEGVMAFLSKGDGLRNELDEMVQSRLWPSETVAP